jgi:hypothetical protein
MIVQRQTWYLKPGTGSEAIALVQEMVALGGEPHVARIYTPSSFGVLGAVAIEAEYESLDECQAMWARWLGMPEGVELRSKFDTLTTGGKNEFWELAE